ncbi:TonB-dependent receptor domain-containing protein [Methylomonas methanica]|uniref:TonB-dependent receptor domain-containing protein n=1 Tax=Methylomonas methanica TaxID=421 RepID=UPI001E5BC761|nr:TonB-dependent receptor [Methylomonas methanica]
MFKPEFSFRERYDNNVRMQINPRHSNLISTISPGVMFGYLADDNELNTRFRWNELIYSSDSALDFSEKLVNLSHKYQGERFKTDLAASYAEESSINNQLDPTVIDPTQINEAGGVQLLVPRNTKSVSPTVTYNLTEKSSLQLGYSYQDVAFDRAQNLINNLNYSDYSFQQYSATASHAYTERLSFNLTGAYSEYESANQNPGLAFGVIPITTGFSQKSTTFTYQAGLQYLFDEQTQLTFSAGIRDTDTQSTQFTYFRNTTIPFPLSQQSSLSRNTVGNVFSASLARKSDWGDFSLSAGQQLNPASTGNQQTSTTFSARGRYNLTERLSTGINANYLLSESISTFSNDTSRSNNRTFITLSPNVQWRWTPEINLDLSYSYRQQVYESNNQTITGDSVQLQFSYQPQINRQVK